MQRISIKSIVFVLLNIQSILLASVYAANEQVTEKLLQRRDGTMSSADTENCKYYYDPLQISIKQSSTSQASAQQFGSFDINSVRIQNPCKDLSIFSMTFKAGITDDLFVRISEYQNQFPVIDTIFGPYFSRSGSIIIRRYPTNPLGDVWYKRALTGSSSAPSDAPSNPSSDSDTSSDAPSEGSDSNSGSTSSSTSSFPDSSADNTFEFYYNYYNITLSLNDGQFNLISKNPGFVVLPKIIYFTTWYNPAVVYDIAVNCIADCNPELRGTFVQ
ncbi:hypothetical protein AX774_g4398 [Zancudomyces culisetae]|uniref:Uncharacterized protein n=1 Tax=Zancudomyces culisetae TaxID=1213189 RepID=A0A1R1PMD3_ZANCU|nr:hypothetical protein AX774_g4398 [Zancudomyces culisetae]|eukprot:OMH82128.1 hypothetical protein AX774_g4398 [Zancudomyces culisetae]